MILAVASVTLALWAPLQLPPIPPLPPLPVPIPPLPPPPVCLEPPLPPLCLPPEPPPPGDDPPRLADELELRREGKYVLLSWRPATDDRGVWGYRLYRDGNYLGRRTAHVRHVRLSLPCGSHSFRVEAVDTAEQTASRSVRVVRRCKSD